MSERFPIGGASFEAVPKEEKPQISKEDFAKYSDMWTLWAKSEIRNFQEGVRSGEVSPRSFRGLAENCKDAEELLEQAKELNEMEKHNEIKELLANLKKITREAADVCANNLKKNEGYNKKGSRIGDYTIASIYRSIGEDKIAEEYRSQVEGKFLED